MAWKCILSDENETEENAAQWNRKEQFIYVFMTAVNVCVLILTLLVYWMYVSLSTVGAK